MDKRQNKHKYLSANLFLNRGEYFKAIDLYIEVIEIEPTNLKAFTNLGVAYKKAGLLEESIRVFEIALKLDSNEPGIYNNTANVYTAMGEFSKAIKYYENAINLKPDYKDAIYNLGNVLYFTGNTEKAVELRMRLAKLGNKKTKQTGINPNFKNIN